MHIENRSVAHTPIAGELEALRREVLAHCYRLAGSLNDAEDIVQETYLRAWQGIDRFRDRDSLRTWLLQLATTVAVEVLSHAPKRVLPASTTLDSREDLLDPLPNAVVWGWDLAGSELDAVVKESLALPLVAALQEVPIKTRAAWILTNVLHWSQETICETLDTDATWLDDTLSAIPASLVQTYADLSTYSADDATRTELATAYCAAFTDEETSPLTSDIRENLVTEHFTTPLRTMTSMANGVHPVIALFSADATGYHAHQLHQLTIQRDKIARVTVWRDTNLFRVFGLPTELT